MDCHFFSFPSSMRQRKKVSSYKRKLFECSFCTNSRLREVEKPLVQMSGLEATGANVRLKNLLMRYMALDLNIKSMFPCTLKVT